jgi:hypothetical protein
MYIRHPLLMGKAMTTRSYRSLDIRLLFCPKDRVRIKLLSAYILSTIVAFGPNFGQAQDISALKSAVQSHACPGSVISVGRLDATAQCDPGGNAGAACDQQNSPPISAWQQCHIEILRCRRSVAQKNEVIDNYNHLVEECRRIGSGTKSSVAKSPTATATAPDKPQQNDRAARQRWAREAAGQAEAARQNAQMLEQQSAEQQAREAAGRICIADTGGYLIDTFTKKSPVWGVCRTSALIPPPMTSRCRSMEPNEIGTVNINASCPRSLRYVAIRSSRINAQMFCKVFGWIGTCTKKVSSFRATSGKAASMRISRSAFHLRALAGMGGRGIEAV